MIYFINFNHYLLNLINLKLLVFYFFIFLQKIINLLYFILIVIIINFDPMHY
jgi:hypothetical protein